MGGPRRPARQFRLYWMHPEMSLFRRFVIRATQELRHNPEARAKASQVLEDDVKPRAKQAWQQAKPEIENAGLGDTDVVIRIAGCPNGCSRPATAEIGIIGYGNIGSQLSVLAEAIGLDVYYYDIVEKLLAVTPTREDELTRDERFKKIFAS